jgi:nitroreductase
MLELLRKRRSVRRFKRIDVEPHKVSALLRAALLSPSSKSLNPWEFIVVTERAALAGLSKAKTHGSSFLEGAALGIVVIADETKSDVWIEDASIASIAIQLVCESLGLSSCWIQIRQRMHSKEVSSEQYVREYLGIPERFRVLSIIAVGYADEEKKPREESEVDLDKIHYHRY